MGCSTSSQTSAVDTTRPSAKPEESNGASTTGLANENGKVAEDSETIPDQTPAAPAEGGDAKPDNESAVAATAADTNSANPPAAEEPKPAAADGPPAETPAADSNAEAPANEEATAADTEPKTEEAPAPSE
ncbi:cytochrome c1 [Mugil cephalus]|uniref:cytochrome c1 n=1 Tax=Mugil cephalus TaxID=48193 RepID=UPI001FB64556|nr:cytochrome c1 [Mugil cephalus]XP_047460323.1 cytochrome c1 [Mugil cephalus]